MRLLIKVLKFAFTFAFPQARVSAGNIFAPRKITVGGFCAFHDLAMRAVRHTTYLDR